MRQPLGSKTICVGTMRCTLSLVVAVSLLLAFATATAGTDGFGHATEPTEGILVLRNGQVLQGRISNLGEYYSILLPEGELRLRRSDVEFACRDLTEAYRRKRSSIARENVLEHLQLAQWCVRHGLLEEAAAEIAEARRLEPNHPLIAAAERRLEAALQPAPPPAPQTMTANAEVSFEQLDQLLRQLPPGSVENFTRHVQPLLMNSCAAGGCHGPNAEKFPLLRVPVGKLVTKRITQRNIYQALKYVDARKPEASPLLTIPLQPHGHATAPIFTDRNAAQHERLVQWVMQVTGRAHADSPATVSRHPLSGISAAHANEPGYYFPDVPAEANRLPSATESQQPRVQVRTSSPNAATALQPATEASANTTFDGTEEGSQSSVQPAAWLETVPASPQSSAAQLAPAGNRSRSPGNASDVGRPSEPPKPPPKLMQPVIPADPFDPEIFNRRYFGR